MNSLVHQVRQAALAAMAFAVIAAHGAEEPLPVPTAEDKLEWFQDAKFGLFLHWSAAVQMPEVWERLVGVRADDRGGVDRELMWSMARRRIPREKYRNLPREFNPVNYNADEIARLAKDAGMRYVVYTAKHHDGFAMYASRADQFNIIDATPFKRDPFGELASACKRIGMPLGFYYSQAQDWMHPDAAGNDWDGRSRDEWRAHFPKYLAEKCKPQVSELLKNYGPMSVLWFDTPATINAAQSSELVELVRSIQPQVMVNSRVGNGAGDYLSSGDNQVFAHVVLGPWETPATINDHWSWNPAQTTKSRRELLQRLSTIASRGGNYLLNIGPTDKGAIPDESASRLREIGAWLKINGDAIYGAKHNPFLTDPEWGVFTRKKNKLFAHVYAWPDSGKIEIRGLACEITSARLLGAPGILKMSQKTNENGALLTIQVPGKPADADVSIVELQAREDVLLEPFAQQNANGILRLDAFLIGGKAGRQGKLLDVPKASFAKVIGKPGSGNGLRLNDSGDGSICDWTAPGQAISWQTRMHKAGKFDVWVIQSKQRQRLDSSTRWAVDANHKVSIAVGTEHVEGSMAMSARAPFELPNGESAHRVGTIDIAKPGIHSVEIRPMQIDQELGFGLTLRAVVLVPRGA